MQIFNSKSNINEVTNHIVEDAKLSSIDELEESEIAELDKPYTTAEKETNEIIKNAVSSKIQGIVTQDLISIKDQDEPDKKTMENGLNETQEEKVHHEQMKLKEIEMNEENGAYQEVFKTFILNFVQRSNMLIL